MLLVCDGCCAGAVPAPPRPCAGGWVRSGQSVVRTLLALRPCTMTVRPSRRAPETSTLLTDAVPSPAQRVPEAVLPDTSMRLPLGAALEAGCVGSAGRGTALGRAGRGTSLLSAPGGPMGPTGPTGPTGPAARAPALTRSNATSAPPRTGARSVGNAGFAAQSWFMVQPFSMALKSTPSHQGSALLGMPGNALPGAAAGAVAPGSGRGTTDMPGRPDPGRTGAAAGAAGAAALGSTA